MGLPEITVIFKQVGATAIQRGQRGVVALVLRDVAGGAITAVETHELIDITDVPASVLADNKSLIELAFLGYTSPPKKVIISLIPNDGATLDGLAAIETLGFNYLACPSLLAAEGTAVNAWVKSQNDTLGKKFIAVLPDVAGDHESIVNFTTEDILYNGTTHTTAQYSARIAGLLAGTSLTISSTYAPLPEVTGFTRITNADMNTAINNGEFILYNDGEKIKVARGVNSLVTLTQDKGESFQKIKIVEAMNMMTEDIRRTLEDNYIGKYANSYDNKTVIVSAIQGYIDTLAQEGILDINFTNIVFIDVEAQRTYLKSIGVAVEDLTEQQIKEANTRDKVFLASQVRILDAIEDITLNISI